MRLIKEVICSKCGKKQIKDIKELLVANLFWRTCEFCNRYGLYRVTRWKLTSFGEWLMALYQSMDLQRVEKAISSGKEE